LLFSDSVLTIIIATDVQNWFNLLGIGTNERSDEPSGSINWGKVLTSQGTVCLSRRALLSVARYISYFYVLF
jgi:hypothetical protein